MRSPALSAPGFGAGLGVGQIDELFCGEEVSAHVLHRPLDPGFGQRRRLIAERFGVRVHPRSIERAVARYQDQHSKSH
jgi:hypothetical protein